MTQHQLFLWASYGVFAIALAIEVGFLRQRHRRTLAALAEEQQLKKLES